MQRAVELIPLGVPSSRRASQRPFPIAVDRADGSRVYDLDENEYIDYVGGWGPMLLGHQFEPVLDAVREQLTRGVQYAAAHKAEVQLAERIVRLVPCAEMVTFLSTGSEAVQAALAIARGATGRRRVMKFDGHFNGWIAPMQTNLPGMPPVEGELPYPLHPEPGWPATDDDVVICPWNDVAAFEALMSETGDTLAAIIMEAIPINSGPLLPHPGYLERVRELSTEYGVVLIFDEVITGFRMAPGGAQELLGVTPDMATFAKALANGFQISAVAGRREIMSAASEGPVRVLGTYNGHPVSIAAAIATLAEIEERGAALYAELERRASTLAEGIRRSAKKQGAPIGVLQVGSVIGLTWGLEAVPHSYRDLVASNRAALADLGEQLTLRGILTQDGRKWLVSAAHSDQDIADSLIIFDAALASVVGSEVTVGEEEPTSASFA